MTLYVNDNGTWKEPLLPYVNDGGTWKEANEVWANDAGVWKRAYIADNIPVYGTDALYDQLSGDGIDNPILWDSDDNYRIAEPTIVNNIRRRCFSVWFATKEMATGDSSLNYAEISYDLTTVTFPLGSLTSSFYNGSDIPGCDDSYVMAEQAIIEYDGKWVMFHCPGASYSWGPTVGVSTAPIDEPTNFTHQTELFTTDGDNGNPRMIIDNDGTLYLTLAPYNYHDGDSTHMVRLFRVDDYMTGEVTDLGQIFSGARSGFNIHRLPEDDTYYWGVWSDHDTGLYIARCPIAEGINGSWSNARRIKSGIWITRDFAYHDHAWYMAFTSMVDEYHPGDNRDINIIKTPTLA